MAYVEPKTTWTAGNIPVASDLNRIEGNTKQNHEDIVSEAAARAADVDAEESARVAAINTEAGSRSSADITLQTNINSEASSRSYMDQSGRIPSGTSRTLPAGGTFMWIQIATSGSALNNVGSASGGATLTAPSNTDVCYWRIS